MLSAVRTLRSVVRFRRIETDSLFFELSTDPRDTPLSKPLSTWSVLARSGKHFGNEVVGVTA